MRVRRAGRRPVRWAAARSNRRRTSESMISEQENERLTRVGPGTPMGTLLRRYWHPIAAAEELAQARTKRVRLLGEDLVLYRDRSGGFGSIAEQSHAAYPVEEL